MPQLQILHATIKPATMKIPHAASKTWHSQKRERKEGRKGGRERERERKEGRKREREREREEGRKEGTEGGREEGKKRLFFLHCILKEAIFELKTHMTNKTVKLFVVMVWRNIYISFPSLLLCKCFLIINVCNQ